MKSAYLLILNLVFTDGYLIFVAFSAPLAVVVFVCSMEYNFFDGSCGTRYWMNGYFFVSKLHGTIRLVNVAYRSYSQKTTPSTLPRTFSGCATVTTLLLPLAMS